MDPAQRKKSRKASYFVALIGLLLLLMDALKLIDASSWPASFPRIQGFGLLFIGIGCIYVIRSMTSPTLVIVFSGLFSLLPIPALLFNVFGIAHIDGFATVAGTLTGFALGAAIRELWLIRKAITPQSTA